MTDTDSKTRCSSGREDIFVFLDGDKETRGLGNSPLMTSDPEVLSKHCLSHGSAHTAYIAHIVTCTYSISVDPVPAVSQLLGMLFLRIKIISETSFCAVKLDC